MKRVLFSACLILLSTVSSASVTMSHTFIATTTIKRPEDLIFIDVDQTNFEAKFNEQANKFDDLNITFKVVSVEGNNIDYGVSVLQSRHECYEEQEAPISWPMIVDVLLDGKKVTGLNVPILNEYGIGAEHTLTLLYGDDHQMGHIKKICKGQILVEASLNL